MSSIESYVKRGEDYPLTDKDMKDMTDSKYKIILYHDLEGYHSIDEVLGSNGGAILLFQNESHDSGHWVSLFKRSSSNTIEFFDSYGLKPDQELKYAQYNIRIHDGKPVPHLSHLLEQSDYKVVYNKHKLQKWRRDVSTCGRWSAYRLRHRDLTMDEFARLFTGNRHYEPDFWITVLTGHWNGFNS